MKHLVLTVFALSGILTALAPQSASACSCIMSSPEQNFAQADAVFVGTVTQVGENGDNVDVWITVESQWKGVDHSEGSTKIVRTANNSAACGVSFTKGVSYFVYATESNGGLNATLCSGTTATEYATEDLAYARGLGASSSSATSSSSSSSSVNRRPFTDVASSHPNAKAIEYLKAKGVISGYSDGSFKPNATINRAELLKIVLLSGHTQAEIDDYMSRVRVMGIADVPGDAWFFGYVHFAMGMNIVQGYPDGLFHPERDINFVEAAKIIVLGMGRGGSLETTGEWYAPYLRVLDDASARPASVTSLDQKITRGEMAEIMYRVIIGTKFDE